MRPKTADDPGGFRPTTKMVTPRDKIKILVIEADEKTLNEIMQAISIIRDNNRGLAQ